jgi:hypothetical protein
MSSPKRAAKRTRAKSAPKSAAKPVRAAVKRSRKNANGGAASAQATQLAAALERALGDGRSDAIEPEALQALMTALCKTYAAQIEAGGDFTPLHQRTAVSPTDVMTTASGLLKSANLAVFELGMWQSFTGR